jgi:large subunit ribosomal protein L23
MKDPYTIIKRPIVTEKTMSLSAGKKYTFEVDIDSNKIEIAYAISKIFNVDVVKVNTLIIKGKLKRLGKYPAGKTADWKKAYITIKPEQNIPIFEGA